MKYPKTSTFIFLMAWYLASVAALYVTLRSMGNSGKWPLVALAIVELSAAIFIATKENFLTSTLGRGPTFVVLMALLWSSLPTIFYVSMFVTGETV